MTAAILRLHRMAGAFGAIFLLLSGLTGSLLVFRAELEPQGLAIASVVPGQTVTLQTLANTVRERYPGASFSLRFSETAAELVLVRVKTSLGERLLWLSRANGQLVREVAPQAWGFPRLHALHRNLLLGARWEWLNGVAGLFLLYLCLSGLWFVLARGWWKTLLRGQATAWRARLVRWHLMAGICLAIPLLVAGLSGCLLVFAKSVNPWVNALYGVSEPAALRVSGSGMQLPLDLLIRSADLAMPGGRLVDIRIDHRTDRPVVVRKRLPGEVHPNGRSQVEVNPYDASAVRVTPYARALPAMKLNAWVYAWHIGTFGGVLHRVILLLCGLGLGFLSLAALGMWYLRRRRLAGACARKPV